jgi:hypothetical protein
MLERRSAEEWRAEFEGIMRRYQLGQNTRNAGEKLTRDEAVTGLRRLGFTVGEALRLLRPKGRK